MNKDERPELHIFVSSLVSGRTLGPQVLIEIGDAKTQVNAEKAREIALMILEASEAAMSDAMLVYFLVEKTGAPLDPTTGIVLQEFRQFRERERLKRDR